MRTDALSTAGGGGKATVQMGKGKDKSSVKLEPAGEDTLKGTGGFAASPEIVVTIALEVADRDQVPPRRLLGREEARPA